MKVALISAAAGCLIVAWYYIAPLYSTVALFLVGWLATRLASTLIETLSLGLGGIWYIAARRCKHGDAFTVSALGQDMVWLFDPAAIRQFFTANEEQIGFQAAVEHFTQRVFLLRSEGFVPRHQRLLHCLRGLVSSSDALRGVASQLASHLHEAIANKWQADEQVDLLEAVKEVLFGSAARLLFGEPFLAAHNASQLQQAFFDFEEGFELAASPVPHALQPRFTKARGALLGAFEQSVAAGHFEGTIAGALLKDADTPDADAPSTLLAVLWASMANSIPAAFWALALLLLPENRDSLEQIRAGLPPPGTPSEAVTAAAVEVALDSSGALRACTEEAIRLFSPSIDVRIAMTDLQLPSGGGNSIAVRKGCVLAISPFLSHRDSVLFQHRPTVYLPMQRRAAEKGQPGSQARQQLGAVSGFTGHLAFGGGRFRCPGRAFAEAEISICLAVLLQSYDFELKPQKTSQEAAAAPPWLLGLLQRGGGWSVPASQAAWKSDSSPTAAHYLPDIQHARLVGVKWPTAAVSAHVRRRPFSAAA